MTIYPAIDLVLGKVVRLQRGDYSQMKVYSDDPIATAKGFEDAGASALHIVDLEGAREGSPVNDHIVAKIAAETGLKIQVGGGIRTEYTIKSYLDMGVSRVIFGTAAVTEPGFLRDMLEKYSDAVAVSADIKDGKIAIMGWTETSDTDIFAFCNAVRDMGVKTIICTDISKDGMQSGTNIELYRALCAGLPVDIIASGGVTTIEEIKTLAGIGISGVIVGKALYEGDIALRELTLFTE